MSGDRIARLHEQASENYLNGDYQGALQAWRDILALDPRNEPALDGVRMAAQFVERKQAAVATSSPEIEHEVDAGLSVLDGLGGAARQPAPRSPAPAPAAPSRDPNATMMLDRSEIEAMIDRKPAPPAPPAPPAEASEVPDPARQAEGIDFGDISSVAAIPLGEPGGDAPPRGEPEGWSEPAASAEPPAYGLEAAPAAGTAAAVELKRRVADLLAQAKTKADAGEREEALTILGRVSILDEDNAEAEQLRSTLEADSKHDLDKVEQAIIEGVQALESDRLDDAERLFGEALAISPEHREARHYMETIAARRAELAGAPVAAPAEGLEDLLGGTAAAGDHSAAAEAAAHPEMASEAVPLARDAVEPGVPRPPRSARASSLAEPPAAAAPPRRSLPSPKLLLLGGVAAAGIAFAFLVLPHLTGGAHGTSAAKPVPQPPARPRRAAAEAAPRPDALSVAPATPEDRAKAVASDISDGRREMDSGDFAAAVVSFNEALKLDPSSADARGGLHDAGEKYKAQKAQSDALSSIKLAFRDGEYTSGLRLAYRLPAGIDPAVVDRIKVAGWYDLGIVALRGGDCREAVNHFKEALAIAPKDAEVQRLSEFAKSYAEAAHDRRFLDFVEALQFRTPPL